MMYKNVFYVKRGITPVLPAFEECRQKDQELIVILRLAWATRMEDNRHKRAYIACDPVNKKAPGPHPGQMLRAVMTQMVPSTYPSPRRC